MDLTQIPENRVGPLGELVEKLRSATNIVLITHVNADGDGAGSEAAVAAWLQTLGKNVRITNPTVFPDQFRYLISGDVVIDHTDARALRTITESDLVFVLDTGEPKRVGRHADAVMKRPVAVLDHHPEGHAPFTPVVQFLDTTACATGELVYDLLTVAGHENWNLQTAEAIYTAIITDTGSFRFSNTTPRAHAIAGEMIRLGVDPELMYRRLYGTVPLRRMALLRDALEKLEVDGKLPLTWITITREAMNSSGASSEDLDGMVDYARAIEGTELAILFRETSDGSTKVSFRAAGDVDVNALARQFGGGGHVKAAGALIAEPLEQAREKVLEAARSALREH